MTYTRDDVLVDLVDIAEKLGDLILGVSSGYPKYGDTMLESIAPIVARFEDLEHEIRKSIERGVL